MPKSDSPSPSSLPILTPRVQGISDPIESEIPDAESERVEPRGRQRYRTEQSSRVPKRFGGRGPSKSDGATCIISKGLVFLLNSAEVKAMKEAKASFFSPGLPSDFR